MKMILLMAVLISFNLLAQESSNGTASVYVIRPLSIQSINPNLDFGDIILTGSQFIVSVSPLSGAEFHVIGHPSRNIIITFSSVILNNSQWVSVYGGINGQTLFTPDVVQENGGHITSGNSYQLPGTSGILNLFLGGSINIAANQPYGDYIGNFAINVSY